MAGGDSLREVVTFCYCRMAVDLKSKREVYLVSDFSSQECMEEALAKTKQFLEPTEYVTILPAK